MGTDGQLRPLHQPSRISPRRPSAWSTVPPRLWAGQSRGARPDGFWLPCPGAWHTLPQGGGGPRGQPGGQCGQHRHLLCVPGRVLPPASRHDEGCWGSHCPIFSSSHRRNKNLETHEKKHGINVGWGRNPTFVEF